MQVKTLTIEQMKKINAGIITDYLGCDDEGYCCILVYEPGYSLREYCGGINWYFSVAL